MERITSKRPWDEAKEDLRNEMGYSHIWTRLNAIEDILGDDYELDRLSVLVNQRMTMREDVAAAVTALLARAGQTDTPPWAGLIRKRFEQVR